MKKIGLFILSIWLGFNLMVATGILGYLIFMHKNAPALYLLFTQAEIAALSPKVLSIVNAMAIILNAGIISSGIALLYILWSSSYLLSSKKYLVIFISISFLQIAGFVSDSYLSSSNLAANLISTAIVILGLLALYCYNVNKKIHY